MTWHHILNIILKLRTKLNYSLIYISGAKNAIENLIGNLKTNIFWRSRPDTA